MVDMKVIKTQIEGACIIEPKLFGDSRGYFMESFNEALFQQQVAAVRFVQDNESLSSYGVVRGLHFQRGEYAQAKLVRVVQGVVRDVIVDLRKESPSFGKHIAVELSGDNHRQLFVPRGCAHGFAVLTPTARFLYKCDNYYAPDFEAGIAWDSPELGIDWGIEKRDVVLSEKDCSYPTFSECEYLF